MENNACSILMPDWCSLSHKDRNGCIKSSTHNDSHIFIDQNENRVEWEDDYECNCGCWEEYDTSNVCKTLKNLGKDGK